MRKNLLITFDYELYLGNRSGTVEECMIRPTRQLTEVMSSYGIRAVFFVDTTYLLRLKEEASRHPNCAGDFNAVAAQLVELVHNGHFVYPHIHPHWLDAQYLPESNQWRLNDVSRYRFHAINDNERSYVFDGSVQLLYDILLPAFPEYKVNAYRAGGWCIQPFSDFIPYFEKHHVLYEFSVLNGIFQFTDAQFFDFSNAPQKSVYRFSTDVCSEDPAGKYIQFGISSIDIPAPVNFLNKVWLKVLYKLMGDQSFKRGEGQPSRILSGKKPSLSTGHDLANPGKERICVEIMSAVKLRLYLKFLDENPYMHFISHPKMITGHNLSVFNKFLDKAFEKYTVETDFHKMIP
jgi:hypothetical protein